MKNQTVALTLAAAAFCALQIPSATSTLAADWPQWRGPDRTAHSQEKDLAPSWPKEGPKLLWQVSNAGSGYSTPSIVGDRIYLLSNEGMDNEQVQVRSLATGQPIWSVRIGKVGPNQGPQYPAARSTPTIDGAHLYALGSDGDLACLETATGKIVWQKSLRADFGGVPGKWAYCESPLIDGDQLIVAPGGATATVVALNKKTGQTLWKSALESADEAAYASTIVTTVGKTRHYVQFLQKGLVGIDPKSGKILWRYEKTAQGSPANIPTPIADQGLVFSAAGRSGAGLVKLTESSTGISAEQVYFTQKLPNGIGGAVKVGPNLFGTTSQSLVCADFATGKIHWEDRSVGPASVLYADGKLYLHGENGDVALVEASSESYKEKGRFSLPGQPDRNAVRAKAWAHPVLSQGRLVIRDLNVLWCYDIRKGQ